MLFLQVFMPNKFSFKISFEEVPVQSLPPLVLRSAITLPGARPLRTALVVEDDREKADEMVRLLQENDFLAEAAYSGEDGLARAYEIRPSLLISDVGLPGLDGLTLVDEIAATLPRTKIVLMCEQLPSNMEISTWAVLKKPIKSTELLAVVSQPAGTGKA